MEYELDQDGTLTVYVVPLPSTLANGEYTDCFVTDELPATRYLMRAANRLMTWADRAEGVG